MIERMEAESSHIPGIVALGIAALKADPAPNQRISTSKIQNLAQECVLKEGNYSVVSVKDGQVVAAVSALVHQQMVYERKQASVVQFYTVEAGEGIKLIRMFLEEMRPKRFIKSIVFTVEAMADPRIGKMLKRLGLQAEMPTYVEWR